MPRFGKEDPDQPKSFGFREASSPTQSLGWYIDAINKRS
jgi:hypothetical protein